MKVSGSPVAVLFSVVLLGTFSVVESFSIVVPAGAATAAQRLSIRSSATSNGEDDDDKKEDGLVVDNLDKQLQSLSSKYPTSAASYLEASRKRAELAKAGKLESRESEASDEDWEKAASASGKKDDWEASLKEAGNSDSQILMFTEGKNEDDDSDEGEEEPKLLLF